MMDEVAGTPTIQLEPSWKQHVGDYLMQPQMRELSSFLRQRKASGAAVFPPGPQIFAAFDATPFEQVKVVILGQDPYHGRGQAHGLSFSVQPGVPVPPWCWQPMRWRWARAARRHRHWRTRMPHGCRPALLSQTPRRASSAGSGNGHNGALTTSTLREGEFPILARTRHPVGSPCGPPVAGVAGGFPA